MGIEINDPRSGEASKGGRVVTPSGMVPDGRLGKISPPPPPDEDSGQYEGDPAVVDQLEFYLLNYVKPGLGKQDSTTEHERAVFNQIGCNSCHHV